MMHARLPLVLALTAACAIPTFVAACATDGSTTSNNVVPDPAPLPTHADAGVDAPADAAPCTDCEYFPETCSSDTLCPNGPFDDGTTGFDPRTRITVIRGRSATDVWAAGAVGALAHFDGTSWTRSESDTQQLLAALWLRDSAEVAFGITNIYSRGLVQDAGTSPASAGGWTAHDSPGEGVAFAWAAPGANGAWCASSSGQLYRLALTPPASFATGAGIGGFFVSSIHGISANEFWAVGTKAAAIRVTGAESDAPSVEAFNTQTWTALRGVWAASASEAWAVGAQGTIRHYTGQPKLWDIVSDVPTEEDLNAIWGASSSDIWAVGNKGIVLHYDGKSWSRMKIAGLGTLRPDLFTVWMPAPGHVWIGGQGVILSIGGKP
jgi:hypothetical protein